MTPRPAYPVLVLGSDRAPPDLVAAKLDAYTAAKAADHHLVLLTDEGGDAAGDWARTRDHCAMRLCGPYPQLWPRRLALVRWALEVAAIAEAAVLFGPDRPYHTVLRYLADAAVPVRRVAIPAGAVARPERRTPWAFTPADPALLAPELDAAELHGLPRRLVLDGAGPGGYPD